MNLGRVQCLAMRSDGEPLRKSLSPEPKKSLEPPFFSLESLSLFGRFSTGAQALYFPPFSFISSIKNDKKRGRVKSRLTSGKTYS